MLIFQHKTANVKCGIQRRARLHAPAATPAVLPLHGEFGAGFRLLDTVREDHRTPSGITQAVLYCLCPVERKFPLETVADYVSVRGITRKCRPS